MEQSELLQVAVEVFERLRIPYFVTGSFATFFFGEPRLTNDIDIVADIKEFHVKPFVESFPEATYYVSEDAVREAIRGKSQFNIVYAVGGLKIDVIIPQPTPFNESRFDRAVRIRPSPSFEAEFSTPEDVIVKKMEFYKSGESEKHLRDIKGVLKVSGDRIDRAYIERWADRLGVRDIWNSILQSQQE